MNKSIIISHILWTFFILPFEFNKVHLTGTIASIYKLYVGHFFGRILATFIIEAWVTIPGILTQWFMLVYPHATSYSEMTMVSSDKWYKKPWSVFEVSSLILGGDILIVTYNKSGMRIKKVARNYNKLFGSQCSADTWWVL